jgi:ABC-type phosphate transport system ATPase subunit
MQLTDLTQAGHSSKASLVKNLTVYFASYNLEKVSMYLAEDVKWQLVGDTPISGKSEFLKALKSMKSNTATSLILKSVLTHGKHASIHGEMLMEDQSRYAFADFYEFKSAGSNKATAITSFVVSL